MMTIIHLTSVIQGGNVLTRNTNYYHAVSHKNGTKPLGVIKDSPLKLLALASAGHEADRSKIAI